MDNRYSILKDWLIFLWIEFRVASPAAIWLLPLIAGGGLLLLLDDHVDASTRLEYISIVVEIIFPLGIMFVANGIILREQEEIQLAFLAVRSQLTVLFLRRIGTLLLASSVWIGALLLIYHFFYLPLSISKMILTSLSVSLALIGISGVVGLAFKEMNAGYLIGTLWWAFCLISSKAAYAIFGPHLYLFYLWFSLGEGMSTEGLLINKLALSSVGLVLILFSILLLRPKERYFT